MKLTWFLTCVFFSFLCAAQHEQYVDSIATLIRNEASDSQRTSHYYNATQYAIMQLGDLVLTRKYADSTMHYAIKSGHTKLEAQCHFAFGLLERVEGNYDKALDHLEKNIQYFHDDSLMKPYALFQVGVIYRNTGELEKGLETYYDILNIFEARQDTMAMASTLNSIANVYGEMDKYEESISIFEKARSLFIAKDIKRDVSNTEKSIAQIYLDIGEDSKALEYASSALHIAQEIDYIQLIGASMHMIGIIHFKTDENKGLEHFLQAKEVLDQTEFAKDKLALDRDLGLAYYQLGRYKESKSLLLSSLADADEINVPAEAQTIAEALSIIYADESNYEEAYRYKLKSEIIKDSVFNIENVRSINELQEQYQSIKKDAELAHQKVEIQKRTSQRNLAYAGGLGFLALGVFLFYRSRKNQKLAATRIENLEKHQKLMALDYMVQGQEVERKRIAQDLHDGLGGLLSTARLQIQNVQNEINKLGEMNLLNDAEALINNACTEVRRISHDMMPGALIDLGLVDAVEDLTANIMEEQPIQITVEDRSDDLTLDDNQKVQLYRICQELLNNTIKHADAKRVRLEFIKEDAIFTMKYTDDGKGFDSAELDQDGDSGLGLKNIESRVKYLNGSLAIESEEGDGVSFAIGIPLQD